MALYNILVISVLVVLAQGSYLSSVNQESGVGVHQSGVISSGAPAVGITRGHSAAQPQRPISGYGSLSGPVGGSRRVPPVGVTGSRPRGGAPRRPSAGAHGRPNVGGSAHGNSYQNRQRSQKPY
ncbi:GD20233 [Drosophila simulans]|uniref:GD20233 n=1 Tax=Drosophila simulans TaxID=7240 RepID=B4QVQ5_DROSI|nr:GD20233 [Drosophila simulans]